jgi:hypothetical protein
VKYGADEIAALAESGGILPKEIHIIKKVFNNSEVVRYDNENRTEDQGKFSDGGNVENVGLDSGAGEKIQANPDGGEEGGNGCLDIY